MTHLITRHSRRIYLASAGAGIVLALSTIAPPAAATSSARPLGTVVTVGANKSNNWSGYNQGSLEQGHKLFHQVAGDWTVPSASAHTGGQAAYSAAWVGIGGGCVDKGCLLLDNTLIQAGTGQDVDSRGHASYYAWWETIPAPSVRTKLLVRAGDRIHVDIRELLGVPDETWKITINNRSTGGVFTLTVPYTSTMATAEWILETPLVLNGSKVTIGPLPNLSTTTFDFAQTNGTATRLSAAEEIQLVDFSNRVLATPSGPDSDADGFSDCAYASSCPAPGS